jgi:hypothetical protein
VPQRLLLEGSDIDELLARVRVEHGPDARIVHAEQKLVGGVGGFFARRRFEIAVAVDEEGPTGLAQAVLAATAPASIDDLLALADAQDGAAPTIAPTPTTPTTPTTQPSPDRAEAARAPGRPVSTQSPSFDHFVRDLITAAEGGPLHAVADPEAGFVPAAPRVETRAAFVPDPRLVLLDTLARVAVSPPRELAGTHLVVGPKVRARALARAWLAECGEDAAALAEGEVEDALAVPAARGGRLVVVEAHAAVVDARRVGRRLAELAPGAVATVTALVDARWDVATSRAWLAALSARGAQVDHLAPYAVDDAADPLRLLELGVPVTWLDARPATLGAWAGPCLDRL